MNSRSAPASCSGSSPWSPSRPWDSSSRTANSSRSPASLPQARRKKRPPKPPVNPATILSYPILLESTVGLMRCPFCGHPEDKVVDSRESKEGESIRRRRECLKCEKRFTTYERIDEIPYMVVKKDGRRERFERQKVLNGLLRACEKRPVSMSRLEQIVNDAEGFVVDSPDRERKTSEVGELIMNRLKRIDKVAYVRFASVYLDFKDVREFMAELEELLDTKDNASAKAKTGD